MNFLIKGWCSTSIVQIEQGPRRLLSKGISLSDKQNVQDTSQKTAEHKQVEQALRGDETLFRQMTENIHEAFWVGSPDWKEVLYISPAYEKIWGRSCESLYAKPLEWLDAVFDGDREQVIAAISRNAAGDFTDIAFPEYRILRPDGTERWIFARAFPIRDAEGKVYRVAGIAEDITKRKQAEIALRQERDLNRRYLDTAQTLMVALDYEGRITMINRAGCALLGYTEDELLGRDWFTTCLPQHVLDKVRAVFRKLLAGNVDAVEYFENPVLCRDGSEKMVAWHNTVLCDERGKIVGTLSSGDDITARKQAETALQENEKLLSSVIGLLPVGVWIVDAEGNLASANAAAQQIWEGSRYVGIEQFGEYKGWWLDSKKPIGPHEWAAARAIEKGETSIEEEIEIECFDGTHKIILNSALPIRGSDGAISGAIIVNQDITERKQAEVEHRLAAAAFESQEGMMITDANKVILKVNRAFTEITGYTAEEVVGQTPEFLRSGRHNDDFYHAMWETIHRTGSWQGEVWDRCKNGEIHPKWLTVTAVKSDGGTVTHYVGTHTDITERKAAEEQIEFLAYHDTLTGLPNRLLLLDRLKQALAASIRSGHYGALFLLDMDNFKTLNDTLGHDKGDLLLQQVAQRLMTCVREGDTVARLGGDEFVVMLDGLSENLEETATQAETVGVKMLTILNQLYLLAGHKIRSTPSIGVTLFGGHQNDLDELLKQADLAMYQSKTAGRNTLHFFDPKTQALVVDRAALEAELREALRQQQFVVYYQAQVIGAGRLTGAEALVRWQHPQRGLVLPDKFIPLAEETGLILPLGQWVLETACAQLVQWAAQPDTAHLTLAVNVSAKQLHQTDFVDQVLGVIGSTGANPHRLKLELTESLLVSNVEAIIAKMSALKAHGVGFALDDFGTGYSSLSYLKRLPLDLLKIDRSFVRDILTDPNDAAIAKMVIALAESLGLAAIAEGVEIDAQRDFLARHGCHAYQGYLFGRPLPRDKFEELVKRI